MKNVNHRLALSLLNRALARQVALNDELRYLNAAIREQNHDRHKNQLIILRHNQDANSESLSALVRIIRKNWPRDAARLLKADRSVDRPRRKLVRPSFPRFIELLRFALPRKIQKSLYEPYREELLEDYIIAKRRIRTKWARRWLALFFAIRTSMAVVNCLRAWGAGSLLQALSKLAPERFREWWHGRP